MMVKRRQNICDSGDEYQWEQVEWCEAFAAVVGYTRYKY